MLKKFLIQHQFHCFGNCCLLKIFYILHFINQFFQNKMIIYSNKCHYMIFIINIFLLFRKKVPWEIVNYIWRYVLKKKLNNLF